MGRWKLLSSGGSVLAASALLACGIVGCGGSTDPRNSQIVGAPGQNGTGGGGETTTGAGGSAATGTAPAAGSTIFAESYGDEGEQFLAGIATDASGHVYVAGNEMPVNIAVPGVPEQQLAMQGTQNGVFLLQYSSTGELMWRQPFTPAANSTLEFDGVAVQQTTGLEIVVGALSGSVNIAGTTLTSGDDPQFGTPVANLWLTAIDSAGYVVWTAIYPSPKMVFPHHVFVTNSGDIEVVGGTVENASVGGAPLCCGNGITGPQFAARYSPTGTHLWSKPITGSFSERGSDADADGGLVIGGFATGAFGYGGETFADSGVDSAGNPQTSAAVVRLDPQGNKRWVQVYTGPTEGLSFVGAALDSSMNVILYGQFGGALDLGGGHTFNGPTALGALDGLLAKLSADGTTVWADQFPGGFDQLVGMSATADAAGDIALAGGALPGGVTFGSTAPLPSGTAGQFVASFTSGGGLRWTRGFATQSGQGGPNVTGLRYSPAGLAFSGDFDNTVDFGTGPLTVPGQLVRRGSGPEFVADNVFTLLLAP
jgi:hypothetical protein